MDPESFVDGVREENRTALSRLGSSKALYADTAGEMEPEQVLRAAATAEHHAAETFAAWAGDETDPDVAAAFGETADEEREHYATVAGELDGHDPDEPPAIQAHLRTVDGTVERVGGLLGRTLAADRSKDQVTGFFVGQADPGTSQLFREMGEDLDDQLERATDLLQSLCGDDADCWERAGAAASEAIQAAYAEYTASLEEMGVDPKPVC